MERTLQKYIPIADEGTIAVDIYGESSHPALVILPGAMSDAQSWGRFAGAISAWGRTVVINRRGRAPSAPLPANHSIETEIADVEAVLDAFDVGALFGWSLGGLIALHVATRRSIDHVISYDPIMRPFGAHALPALETAHRSADWDAVVEIINRQISGFDDAHVEALRADTFAWNRLRDLGRPLYPETLVINSGTEPEEFASQSRRIDLIVGSAHFAPTRGHERGQQFDDEHDLGRDRSALTPYGDSFLDVRSRTPRGRTHLLQGQGHMAHLLDPTGLAATVDRLI